MDIANKVAIVTGGGSGIGEATARKLADLGAAVVVADVVEEDAARTVSQIEQQDGTAAFVRVDVTKYEDLEHTVSLAERLFGGVDILHNNAGVNTGRPRYPYTDRARWERTLAIDLWAVLAGIQAALPALQRRGRGVIVNTGSMAGVLPFFPDPAYAAAKHGVVGLTRSLAFLRDETDIRVNCVCPGVVDTPLLRKCDLTEEDRETLARMNLIPPAEVADAVIEVIKDDSLNGEVMGLLAGKPPKLIPTPVSVRDDPSQRMQS